TGVINGNHINSNSNVNGQPGIAVGVDQHFAITDNPSLKITSLDGNVIQNTQGNGILAKATDSNGSFQANITNNNVAAPLGGVRPGIRVDSGSNTTGENTSVCVNLTGNTSAGSGGTNGIGLRRQGSSVNVPAGDVFNVVGMAATSSPGVDSYVSGLNPNGSGVLLISATSGFGNCGTITQIAKPDQANQPYYLARSNEIFKDTESDSYFSFKNVKTNYGSVTDAFNSVNPTISASVTRPASVLPGAQISAEKSSSSNESAQPSLLARAAKSVARFARAVDSLIEPAAYAKEAPRSEVSNAGVTGQESGARTTEVRGQRSEIRRDHARNSKLEARNSKPETRSATMTPFAACSPAGINGGGTAICVDLPTIHNGDSITITFQVTVNNPPNLSGVPPGTPQVTNFGTVTGGFAGSPLNTNSVNTPVDLFDSTTALVSNNNPASQGDSITFTATVAISGSQSPTPPSPITPTGTVTFKSDSVAIGTCTNVALVSGQAQCTISSLTPPSHNITADYSGNGNYDPSTSNTVVQTVNACTVNPVVTNTNDSGAGSLRDAISNACNNNTITFNIPNGDPGHSGGVYTISLTSAELAIARNVTITGPNSVTNTDPIVISGNNA